MEKRKQVTRCQCPAISEFNGIEVTLLNLKFVHVLVVIRMLLNGAEIWASKDDDWSYMKARKGLRSTQRVVALLNTWTTALYACIF